MTTRTIWPVVLALFAVTCGDSFDSKELYLASSDAGTDAASELDGSGGSAGSTGGTAGSVLDAATEVTPEAAPECPALMFRAGSICIDKQPALLGDGSQSSGVSFADAKTICTARGARLCTEAEREASCPGGPEPTPNGANHIFCFAPGLDTQEWSATTCTSGQCRSPCCAADKYPCSLGGVCDSTTPTGSFHCCKETDP